MEEENKQESKLIKGVLLKGKELVRICNPDKKHHGYEWHDGENVDILPFMAKGSCSEGGLYFTTLEKLLYFNDYTNYLGNHWFVRVTVDDNEEVWQEPDGKWKAHRVMVTSMTQIKDMPEEMLYKTATSDLQKRLGWVSKPFDQNNREELWCEILELRPLFLQFIRDQTDLICQTAVVKNNNAINWVRNPTLAAALADEFNRLMNITNWSCSLMHVLQASGKYQFKCINRYTLVDPFNPIDPEVLRMSCESDEEFYGKICLLVVNTNDIIRGFIRDPSREMIDLVLVQQSTPLPFLPLQFSH